MGRIVLFGEEWKRQVREALNLLEDKGTKHRFYDTTSNISNRVILFNLTTATATPILFDDGVMINGIAAIREYLA
jgi:hypothetical protein